MEMLLHAKATSLLSVRTQHSLLLNLTQTLLAASSNDDGSEKAEGLAHNARIVVVIDKGCDRSYYNKPFLSGIKNTAIIVVIVLTITLHPSLHQSYRPKDLPKTTQLPAVF